MTNSISCFQNLDQLFLIDFKTKLENTFVLISRTFPLKKVISDLIFAFSVFISYNATTFFASYTFHLPQWLGTLDEEGLNVQHFEVIVPTAAISRFHLVGIVQALERRLRNVDSSAGGNRKEERISR